MDSDEVEEVEILEGKSARKRSDWEREERVWRKQVENELTDIKGMIKFIHETVIGLSRGMKMSMETSRQVRGMVERLLEDDDDADEKEKNKKINNLPVLPEKEIFHKLPQTEI